MDNRLRPPGSTLRSSRPWCVRAVWESVCVRRVCACVGWLAQVLACLGANIVGHLFFSSLAPSRAPQDPAAYAQYYQQYMAYYNQYMMAAQQQVQAGLPSAVVAPPGVAPQAMYHNAPPPVAYGGQPYAQPMREREPGTLWRHAHLLLPRSAAGPYVIPELPPPPPLDSIPTPIMWVGFVPPDATEEELREIFALFGPMEHVRVVPHKNCAFVRYVEKVDAWRCVMATSQRPVMLRGHVLKVSGGSSLCPIVF